MVSQRRFPAPTPANSVRVVRSATGERRAGGPTYVCGYRVPTPTSLGSTPLLTVLLAAALLAALTGASNRPSTDGDRRSRPCGPWGWTDERQGRPGGDEATRRPSRARPPTTTSAAAGLRRRAGVHDHRRGPRDHHHRRRRERGGGGGGVTRSRYEPDEAPARVRATPPPVEPPEPPPVIAGLTRLPNVELEVLTLTNMDRGSNGVPPISRDGCLDAEASAWAHAMAESGVMAHSAGGGAAVQGCRGAERLLGRQHRLLAALLRLRDGGVVDGLAVAPAPHPRPQLHRRWASACGPSPTAAAGSRSTSGPEPVPPGPVRRRQPATTTTVLRILSAKVCRFWSQRGHRKPR